MIFIKKKVVTTFLVIILILGMQTPALAASVYARAASPNDTVFSTAVTADVDGSPPPYLQSVSVSTAGLQSGDVVKVVFYESNNTTVISEVTTTGGTVTAPSNTFFAYVKIITGSATGVRYAWFNSATNTINNTAYFDAPDTSDAGGGGSDPGGGNVYVDLTELIAKLNTIISNQELMLEVLGSGVGGGEGGGDFTVVITKLNNIISNQDDILSEISSLENYITSPRNASDLDTSALSTTPTFDPSISEPYQQPYNYNRKLPEMPPFEDSPGPLPVNPEPTIMPHDPVNQRDNPLGIDTPKNRDPVKKDNPLVRDPVKKDNPIALDPVNMDGPLQRDPVQRDNPIDKDIPIGREASQTRDDPIVMDKPFIRTNPIEKDPPMN